MPVTNLSIDIISDLVCPWCVVGCKSLEQALALLPEKPQITLRWHPFELNPGLPPGGLQHPRPFVSDNLLKLAREVGFRFDFANDKRIYNTRKAHRLMHVAGQYNKQTQLSQALFAAYFLEHRALDDDNELLSVARSVGLDSEHTFQALHDPRVERAVEIASNRWLNDGVNSVPTFVINQKFAVSGAQSVEQWLRALKKLTHGKPVARLGKQ